MIKIIDNDITRGGEKIGWITGNDIINHEGKKIGYFTDDEVYDAQGKRLAKINGNRVYAGSRQLNLDNAVHDITDAGLSNTTRVAIFLLFGS